MFGNAMLHGEGEARGDPAERGHRQVLFVRPNLAGPRLYWWGPIRGPRRSETTGHDRPPKAPSSPALEYFAPGRVI